MCCGFVLAKGGKIGKRYCRRCCANCCAATGEAGTLTDAELREHRSGSLGAVRRAVLDVSPLPNGYAYVFEATSEILSQLARLVDLERQCCAFLTFRIVVEAGLQPICIEITGPPEAKAIIADFFGS
jgi:hypothetical protein